MQIIKLFVFLFLGLQFKIYAATTITSISGVSYFETDANGNYTIYGGVAGACISTDGTTTCNSCTSGTTSTSTPAKACNPKSIYSSLRVTISYKLDKAVNGVIVSVTGDNASGVESTTSFANESTVTASAGEIKTVTFTWEKLCALDNLTGCLPSTADQEVTFANGARNIYLGVDLDGNGSISDEEKKTISAHYHYVNANDTTIGVSNINSQNFCLATDVSAKGLCGYKLGIGDSKLYLEQTFSAVSAGSSPAKNVSTAPDWYGVALFATDLSAVNIISTSMVSEPKILKFNSLYALDDNVVDGLTNYTNYCLLMGNVSKSQNIFKFNNLGADSEVAANVCGSPSEVVGLLSDKSCFISTAAFGSDMASQVQILREFRNQYLLPHSWGRLFVKKYYEISPPIAQYIKTSEKLKFGVRLFLYPLIGLSWLLVQFGILNFIFIVMLSLGLFYFSFRFLKKGRLNVV